MRNMTGHSKDDVESPESDQRHQEITSKIISTCQRIASILAWSHNTIGTPYYSALFAQSAGFSCYQLLNDLNNPRVPPIFHTMVVTLSVVSKRWKLVHGIVRMIWINLQDRQEPALTPLMNLLRISAEDSWKLEDNKVLENCLYPDHAALKEGNRDLADMGDLLQKWEKMNVTKPGLAERERP